LINKAAAALEKATQNQNGHATLSLKQIHEREWALLHSVYGANDPTSNNLLAADVATDVVSKLNPEVLNWKPHAYQSVSNVMDRLVARLKKKFNKRAQ
jgi:hypothetical protein